MVSTLASSSSSTQPKDKGQGKKLIKHVHEDSSSDEEFDSKKTLKELIVAIKHKPHEASPKPQLIAGYGAHPPVNVTGSNL